MKPLIINFVNRGKIISKIIYDKVYTVYLPALAVNSIIFQYFKSDTFSLNIN